MNRCIYIYTLHLHIYIYIVSVTYYIYIIDLYTVHIFDMDLAFQDIKNDILHTRDPFQNGHPFISF